MEEIWKDIPGYEGLYQASTLGRVKKLPHETVDSKGIVRGYNGRIVPFYYTHNGYCRMSLYKDGSKKNHFVHKLVGMAFLEHNPQNHDEYVHHVDSVKTNNKLSNLKIVSHRENCWERTKKYGGSSKFMGVSWDRFVGKWVAKLYYKGKKEHLGYFEDEEKASEAYQTRLKEVHGR